MSARDTGGPSAAGGDDGEWAVGPDAPRLAAGTAQVWLADLHAIADDALGTLSGDELGRAANVAGEHERVLWSRSRAVLRDLLGRYLQCDPAAVELTIATRGKPELASTGGRRAELFFNLSHSQHLALYAFSADAPVGVDVQVARGEGARTGVDHIALARRAFGEHEAQRLSLVEPARREREFLRAWTCHEARLKLLGTGIGASGEDDVGADPTSAPWIAELGVGGDAAAALALATRPGELRRWAWTRGSSR